MVLGNKWPTEKIPSGSQSDHVIDFLRTPSEEMTQHPYGYFGI